MSVRPQFSFNLHEELIGDNFAGGGGASTGIEMALGRHPDHAINHDKFALGMHRINHPQTVHHPEDVFAMDPTKLAGGKRWGFGWFSPDCKHFSKAKGGKPLSKKIRGLAFVMLRWAKAGMRVIEMENVEEIATWGPLLHHPKHQADCVCGKPCGNADPKHKGRTWDAFKAALSVGVAADHPDMAEMLEVLNFNEKELPNGKTVKIPVPESMRITREELIAGFGFEVQTKVIRACDFGAPTIRKRLYMIARCDGRPIVWPEATHSTPETAKARGLKPYRTMAECIDWSVPCHSIFLTKLQAKKARCRRPLATSTLRRVATGIDRFVLKAKRPFLVSLTHQGGDRVESLDEPGKTVTAAHRGEKALVVPFMKQSGHSHSNSKMVKGANEPLRTQTGHAEHNLVEAELAPFLTEHANSSNQRNIPVDKPGPTFCAETKGGSFAVVAGTLVGAGGPAFSGKPRAVDKPGHTQTTENHTNLVAATLVGAGGRAAQSRPRGVDEPNHTGTAKADQCLAAVNLVKLRGTTDAHLAASGKPADEPIETISADGQHHAVSACFLAQHNTGVVGHPATEPCSTISSKGSQQQLVAASAVAYYGNDKDGQALTDPARTVTTDDRFGLVESELVVPLTEEQIFGARRVAAFLREYGVVFEGEFATVGGYVIVDIGMRMLTPRELFRAQGFPESYVIDRAWVVDPKTGEIVEIRLTKEQQIRMCGNSVCPPVAEALVRANVPELCVWNAKERKRFVATRFVRQPQSVAD